MLFPGMNNIQNIIGRGKASLLFENINNKLIITTDGIINVGFTYSMLPTLFMANSLWEETSSHKILITCKRKKKKRFSQYAIVKCLTREARCWMHEAWDLIS